MSDRPKVLFDPDDHYVVKHTRIGVWNHYKDISYSGRNFNLPLLSKIRLVVETSQQTQYVTRMLQDVFSISECRPYLALLAPLKFAQATVPAISLWYSSQMLLMVEKAMVERTVSTEALLWTAGGRIAAVLAQRLLGEAANHVETFLQERIEEYYSVRVVQAVAKFDLPTFSGTKVQRRVGRRHNSSIYSQLTWNAVASVIETIATAIRVSSQFGIVFNVLRGHQDAAVLGLVTSVKFILEAFNTFKPMRWEGVHVYKVDDKDYLCKEGLRSTILDPKSRKDIVAGGLGDFLWQEYKRRADSLEKRVPGNPNQWEITMLNDRAGTWRNKLLDYASDPFDAIAQIYICYRVIHSPASVPFSLATLQLVNTTLSSLNRGLFELGQRINHLSERFKKLGDFYELFDIRNKLEDGIISFPVNTVDLSRGVSVEFKNVSFSYSNDSDGELALKNVSFEIGENGSGKSTILNLITRIYDVTEGQILINGLDIRTLKLDDVRKATAVLFQEYAMFPLTLGENIGLGDPAHADDMDMIQEAAKLGGADFIDTLPYKFETYISRPVDEIGYGRPSSNSAFSGKEIDFTKFKLNDDKRDLSGGQKQRIALSRTFMKSLVSPSSKVGLLLFDEPSAALDPKAEHTLFTRLRELRGNKTMVFSTHRFGKLTRHADLILYVDKGNVLEAGNHVSLMERNGEYAKFWNLQAEDFQ
ncbi:hypothetical protein EST38_g7471 [Candolleomyces aberdarensis]|uniref:ABC transporter domain-containing protein n=1 Tax=Candolleomyces aberdarensis TaxID=2316362 RepID=A0A4Q2DGU5_9AGAR|nr:hypothetical protein EST38_g7471 [Candolleomyces aberdarensis]